MTIKWNGDAIVARIRKAAMTGVVNSAEAIRDNAVARIQSGEKTGHIYRRRGVEHQASAPGEAPATDTGNLANQTRIDYDTTNVKATLTFSAAPAARLEFGDELIEPRPFVRPALTEEAPNIRKKIGAEITAALKEIGGLSKK